MPAIPKKDLVPGMVVHIETDEVRRLGGAFTTARIVNGVDRAVTGPHYFLLLRHDAETDLWMAAPLFSNWSSGSVTLDEGLKSGLRDKWIGHPSNYSAWQMWRIPPASIEAASTADESSPTDRRLYADGQPQVLDAIARDREDQRDPYRPV